MIVHLQPTHPKASTPTVLRPTSWAPGFSQVIRLLLVLNHHKRTKLQPKLHICIHPHLLTESIVLLLYFLCSCFSLLQQALQLCDLLFSTLYIKLLGADLNGSVQVART
eukprot:GHUV01053953.1.p1 GENE.GHUV01053953.1~~GHUV01053953.1.p1  ORF type:complete len:109 (+),score=8.43 GHUV01053953.1:203-529(+)